MSLSKKCVFVAFITGLSLTILPESGLAGTTGKISGKVVDAETGEGLPGANVVVVGTMSGAATDLNGRFVILNLAPGSYALKASMMGFRAQTVQNVSVNVDLTTKVSFSLSTQILEMGEEVVVTASRPMITKDMTATQATVGAGEIAALPVEEFSDVVQLQAGVVQGRDGGLHIRGGRSDEISYMVDGVALSDVYSGEIAVEVENSSVQELQVISGTFNAEYGRAMSGVVNIVTKVGGDKISGSVTAYSGDYVSSDDDIFTHIDDVEPVGVKNLQFNLQGPLPFTSNKLKFFLTGRYLDDEGYIFGTRFFNPSDSSNVSFDGPSQYIIQATGDGKAVPMRFKKKATVHGKLTYQIAPAIKLSSSLLLSDGESRDWGDEGSEFVPENQFHDFYRFLFNPDGASTQFQNSYTLLTTLDHLLSSRTFYNLNFTAIRNKVRSFVYEDPFDSRYEDPDRFLAAVAAGNTFFTGGTDMWHSERETKTFVGKFDLTSQVTYTHQIKTGVEVRSHELDFVEFKIIPARNENGIEIAPFQSALPPPESPFNNRYSHRPKEIAVYAQDKMEFDFMIVNVGLRYDYFDPNAPVPTDLGDPGNPDKRKDAGVKYKISPRLGIAYPISDRGALHFSYGQFFQMPLFQFLYADSEFEVEIGRLRTLMGNADLEPQKTTIYEVGLQQQLTDDLAFDLTIYSKDIRNLLGTEIYQLTAGADRYARYENRDFGTTRGFVFALSQRHSNWLAASVDYTFQIAEGNASEPNASFVDRRSNREPEKKLVPLDWDQTHTLNSWITMTPSQGLSVTLLGRYGSGLPYTPKFLNVRQAFENTARSRATLTVDLKADYSVRLAGLRYNFFLKVFNLFD
ncbi:MAG: TonB-dependent receptor, partial [Verrucomicrobia bacterium]|nr:TonB-dependent receptor [Verrucomicrobiota bacterium]